MRRWLSLFLLLPLLLSGCGLRKVYPHMERLRVIQTMGIDAREPGLRLTLAAAAGDRSGSDAVCLSADGTELSSALERAGSLSTEESLFCGHIRQLLIGEGLAIDPLLRQIARSSDLRLDMPLYLLQNGSAEELMNSSGSGTRSIGEILDALQAELDRHCDSQLFTARQILRDEQRQGSALLCALSASDAAENENSAVDERAVETEKARTAVLSGFAVLRDGEICAWLDREELLGISLLRGCFRSREIRLEDMNGHGAILEISEGRSRLKPVWNEDGGLSGLDIRVTVGASLLESEQKEISDPYVNDLTAKLEAAVSEELRGLLTRSKSLRADFLGLGPQVEEASPLAFQQLETAFPALLPKLEISLSVQGALRHSNDLE